LLTAQPKYIKGAQIKLAQSANDKEFLIYCLRSTCELCSPIARNGLQKLVVAGAQALGFQYSRMEKHSREKGVQEKHKVGDVWHNTMFLALCAKNLKIRSYLLR